MKKVKSIVALILAAVLVFALAACGQNDAKVTETTTSAETTQATENVSDGEKVKIAAMSGPTGMGIVKLTEDLTYDVKLVTDPTQIPALVATGEVDIAACPLNLAANIYKKTGGKIQMLGINTLGVLYVVTNGVTINGIKDLKDKTIYSTGEGATPEYILDYILEKNGLTDSVKVEFLSEHSELAAKVASGEAQIAVLPEPFVSVAKAKNDKIEVALSLTNEWEEVAPETELAMGRTRNRGACLNTVSHKARCFRETETADKSY